MVVRCKKRIRCHPEPSACHLRLLEPDGPPPSRSGAIRIGPEIGPEPFLCHPERSEGSRYFAESKLREGSLHFQVLLA